MIGVAVVVCIQQKQVTGLWCVAVRICVIPCAAVAVLWYRACGYSCVAQTEVCELGGPVIPVWVVCPCTVASVAVDGLSILCHCVVGCAFCVSGLGLSDGCQVCTPVTCKCHTAYCGLPYISIFYVCIRIGVAGKGMGVFLFAADQFFFITFCCVAVAIVFLLTTDQLFLFLITFCCVVVSTFALLHTAGKPFLCGIAAVYFTMYMVRICIWAGQNLFFCIAGFCVLVTIGFGSLTDQSFHFSVTGFRMLVGSLALLLTTDQFVLIAVLCMGMLLFATVGIRLCGQCREDQCIDSTKNHQTGKDAYCLLPALPPAIL